MAGVGTLERMKKINEIQSNCLLTSNKSPEGTESSLGENDSYESVYKPTTVSFKYESQPGIKRYVHSLKHLLPVRVRTGPGTYMPVDMTGCCAFTFFSWLTPLIWRTFRRGLVQTDLYHCSPADSCHINGARFSSIWSRETKKYGLQRTSLSHTLFLFMKTRYIISCLMYILCVLFGFIGPTIFMRLLLEYIQSPNEDEFEGITWMLGLLFCETLRIFCLSLMWAINIRTSIRASSAVSALLYKKITSLKILSNTSTGELVNLFSNDCRKVFMMVYNFPLIIGGPLVVIGTVVYTYYLLGPVCFVGIAVFLITYGIQFVISLLSARYLKKAIKATDERVSLMSEFLSNVKLIKLYAWEKHLIDNIRGARVSERNLIEKVQYLHSVGSSVSFITAAVATIFTILAFTLFGFDIDPAEAFTLVMVNSIAAHGLKTLPVCFRAVVNGTVALSRLQAILRLEDKENYTVIPNRVDIAVNVSKATLDWEQAVPTSLINGLKSGKGEVNCLDTDNEKTVGEEINCDTALVNTLQLESGLPPALTDLNFTLQRGKLVGICGPFASGKSSIFGALLGQMRLLKGQIAVRGSIAYVPQQPWILNATLRENVLFGELFSSKRYYEAVYACGLPEDIAALPAGDQTELGERGVNVSGGQKQRISLARAQYSDKDLYLLDDPLSSVDNQIGRHIFQHCIKGALKGKSILLVTHQMQYLQECDSIIFMRDGTIMEQGTHTELMAKDSEYASLIQMLSKDDEYRIDLSEENKSSVTDEESRSPSHSRMNSPTLSSVSDLNDSDLCCDGQLTEEEKIASGNISYNTYMGYIAAAGGFIISSLVIIWFIIQAASVEFSKYWLSLWLSQGNGNETFKSVVVGMAHPVNSSVVVGMAHAVNSSVEAAPTFEPINITDHPHVEFYQLVYGLSVLIMLVISLINGYLFTKASLRASSSLHDKLLQKVFRSPMHFFDVTPVGRILNLFTHDVDEIDTHLPTVMVVFLQRMMTMIFALLLVVIVYHWFGIPIIFLGIVFFMLQKLFKSATRDLKRYENFSRSPVFSHVAATVKGLSTIRAYEKQEEFFDRFTQLVDEHSSPQYLYYCALRWMGIRMDIMCLTITLTTILFVIYLRDQVNPAFAALALVLVLQLSGLYQYIVRLMCEVESRFTSVERMQSYIEDLESEAPSAIDKTRPSPDWPMRGHIVFKDVKMGYRPSLPLVLKGLSFEIEHQEKIGIVGRTGAGKSSLGAALFRLVELNSGNIIIDGINIENLGLEDLRSRMSVIPQDPVLFQGSIRYNLDPMGEYEDEILWKVLSEVDMKLKISSLDGGLDSPVVEGGNNFSVGERQLLCMARALLRESKVVLLDEATAAVDNETDKVIQNAINQVFANSTVLTIAHRLTTVANCDRVMVLSEGKIVEFDQPTILLSNPNSHFSKLMAAARPAVGF
ncbi:ATP-binding cassette sub-family C member 12 [Parasteatoda tepidariorum]|uniref:ATP-binding cassette sub-family C member 12 n=1 Tax=Parasteatoda tepidariorum TaxID=114398 RepID=UPI00077F8676|nr:ATP-binding cassette sub-family C member 12 [Parasteatoda tepidariorum]